MDIFYEKQEGGLCRKHALNAYFGYVKISTNEFNIYKNQYDTDNALKFNVNTSCSVFDIVSSNQKNIVSYILKKYNIYTRYYSINQLFEKNIDTILSILNGDFFFIYNDSHIYGARLFLKKWYIVDSLNGVRPININMLLREKNIGYIIPVNTKNEFYTNVKKIHTIIQKKNHYTDNELLYIVKNFLIKSHDNNDILGSLEIPIGICMDLLEFQLNINNNIDFDNTTPNIIDKFINGVSADIILYNTFLSQFTKGKYNDIKLILEYLPNIIMRFVLLNIPE